MAIVSSIASRSPLIHFHRNPISRHCFHSPSILSFPSRRSRPPKFSLKARTVGGGGIRSSGGGGEDGFLRKPTVSPESADESSESSGEAEAEDDGGVGGEGWVDWEDQILEDTVPLVGFVRMILHSGKYGSGDRLSPEHEKTILEKLLPYHPEFEEKIGCGVDYITVGYHPDFETSRCMFIVRKDGELVDFSYWKCIKGLVRKNYPLYADSFIIRHFRPRRQYD
ncbi:Protein DCL like [Actinidia chinensis var. chinensis]|uniref:Protein DCL like n=1 Tax=Actinidia chinensis var. chinensis TaxID=1590841 RepID=A0A2R6Q049_ACTCC|nr:Protein DCL like [Actinidia chinensis var. chinensis]